LIYTNNGALTGQTIPANVSGTGASLSAGSWGILPNADQVKGVGNIPSTGTLEGQSEVIAVFGEAPPAAFDHLAVTATSPQTAGSAFDVTITAQDPSNNTVDDSITLVQVSSPSALMEFDWNGDGTYGDISGTLVNGVKTIKARDKRAETTTITAIATGGVTTPSPANVTIDPGTFAKLQILAPGETAAPGTTTGKTGTPTVRTINVSFNVTVNAVDANWNLVNTVIDIVGITSTDGAATLPSNAPLAAGSGIFAVTLNTVGSFTVTATDVTDGSKTANTTPAITAQGVPIVWQGDGLANSWDISTANWTNLTGTAVAFAVNNQVTFDNTSTNPVVDIVGTVLPNTMTVNSASNYTFSSTSGGLIGGATGLAKSGSGTLTLTTANTFTGPTTVSGGTLALNNNLALQNSVLTTSTNSVTLGAGVTTPTLGGLSGSTALSVFVTNGYSSITALTLNVSAGTNVTYGGGAITNSSMSLTKTGAGTQALSGQSTYTGPTAIQNGTVVISTPNALPITTAVTLGSGGNSGVLQLGDASATRVQTLASLTTSGSGTGNAVVGGNASVSALTLTLASDATYAGLLGGAGANQNNLSLTKNTNGITSPTLILSGANTYNGGTTVNGGVLSVSHNSAAGTGTITLNNTGTALELANGVNLSCPVSIGSPGNRKLIQQQSGATSGEYSGIVTIVETGGGNFAVTNGSGQTLTMSGSVVGAAAGLTKIGAGTLILTGNNTHSGFTYAGGGTLSVNTISDTGASAISTNTLRLDGGTLTYTGVGAATTTRAVSVTAASTIDLPAGNLILDGVTSGSGGLTKSGSGTLSLGGTNDNNNFLLNVTGGEVQLNKASTNNVHAMAGIIGIGNGATVKITGTGGDQIYNGNGANYGVNGVVAGGMFDLNGNSETVSFLNGTGGTVEGGSGTPTLTVGQGDVTSSFSGVIQNTSGTLSLTKNGTGTQTLGGVNTYSGVTTISGGILALSGVGSIGNSPLIDLKANATLDVSAVTGTCVLGAAQTLKGSGTVVGGVTANGQITPGAGIGTLTFSVPPTLNGTIVMELNTTQSPSNDVINVTSGTLAAGGTLIVTNLPGSTLAPGNSFKLFSQPVSGSFSSIVYPAPPSDTVWTNMLAVDGTIALVSTVIAPTPTNITVSVSGGNVILDWPAGQGWQLQAQTNSLAAGITTNWVTVPGAVPPLTNAVDPANATVFYRLVYP
jgi:autotransporter-associated beta strand protein